MPCGLTLGWISPLPLRAAVGLSAAGRVRVRLRRRALRGVRAEGVEGARLVRVRVRVTVGLGFGLGFGLGLGLGLGARLAQQRRGIVLQRAPHDAQLGGGQAAPELRHLVRVRVRVRR